MMDEDGPVVALERIVKNDTPMNSRKYLIDEINRYNKTVRTEDKNYRRIKRDTNAIRY